MIWCVLLSSGSRRRSPGTTSRLHRFFQHLVRLEVEGRSAIVESAKALDKGTKEGIVADLKKKYGDQLTAEFATDPKLIGGIRVRVGSDVWDGSVRNRLERLQNSLS